MLVATGKRTHRFVKFCSWTSILAFWPLLWFFFFFLGALCDHVLIYFSWIQLIFTVMFNVYSVSSYCELKAVLKREPQWSSGQVWALDDWDHGVEEDLPWHSHAQRETAFKGLSQTKVRIQRDCIGQFFSVWDWFHVANCQVNVTELR